MTDQDHKYVYVVGLENKAVRKDVTLGGLADDLRIVRSGLDTNDKVIVAGLQKIFVPDTPVKPKIVAMGALPPAAVVASATK
jgi:membrane fusion protein, multidrug efflux system